MRYRLGIDVGVGSIGAVALDLNKLELGNNSLLSEKGGVARIFPASIGAVERRQAKSMRTQNKRRGFRIQKLKKTLHEILGVNLDFDTKATPKNGNTSVIALRAVARQGNLSDEELARCILHIARNRGIRLARNLKPKKEDDKKAELPDDEDVKNLRQLARNFDSLLEKTGMTAGEFLYQEREQKNLSTRRRKRLENNSPYLVTRKSTQDELKAILAVYQRISDDQKTRIWSEVFWEEKPTLPALGLSCYTAESVGIDEKRLPCGTWLFEDKRLLEELNNIRVRKADGSNAAPLSLEQRNKLYDILLEKGELTSTAIKKELFEKDDKNHLISIEKSYSGKAGAERKIKGHAVSIAINKTILKDAWKNLSTEKQEEVIEQLRAAEDLKDSEAYFKSLLPNTATEEIDAICDLSLPQGFSAAGKVATNKLVEELRKDVISVYEAEVRAGLVRRTAPTGEIFDRLPYYGVIMGHRCQGATGKAHDTNEVQFGKIPNPVVHQFLNQLRKVVNEFIKEHGLPESMGIELSRDLQKSQEERDEIAKKNKNNEKKNAGYDELILKNGQNPSRYYRQCLTLHELQKGICPYTGRNMEIEEIFRGTVNREHILPKGDTLLDGMNNLVLADANANAFKGKRSPYDAFSGGYDWTDTSGKTAHIDYSQILKRVEKYPEEKKWAFYEGAMERFKDEENFLKRFDGDTKYLGKIALEYLQCLYPPNKRPIKVVRGGITAMLRKHWGVHNLLRDMLRDEGLSFDEVEDKKEAEKQKKFREDHRHHLIDALVVGLVNEKVIKDYQQFCALPSAERKRREEAGEIYTPWRDFRRTVRAFISDQGLVSQKSDRNVNAQLHDQMAFSVFARMEDGECIVRQKVTFASMTPKQNKKPRQLLEDIAVPETVLKAAEKLSKESFLKSAKDKKRGGKENPADYLNKYAEYLNGMREELLKLYDHAPPKPETEKINNDFYKLQYALKEYTRTHNNVQSWQSYNKYTVVEIRGVAHPNSEIPQGTYRGRSNSRLDIYLDGNLKLGWEVVTRLNEMKGVPEKWRSIQGAKRLFSLRQSDEVEMFDEARQKRFIARLQKMSDGDVAFFPIEVASADNDHPKKIRISSLKKWKERDIIPVVRTPLGKETFKGKLRNA